MMARTTMANSGANTQRTETTLATKARPISNQGYAAQRELAHPDAAMLAFVKGLCGFPGFEPTDIFRSGVGAGLRGGIVQARTGAHGPGQ